MNRLTIPVGILLLAVGQPSAAVAADHPTGNRTTPPTIESISPRGVPWGAERSVTVEGYNLRGVSAVHFSDPAVRGTVQEVTRMADRPEKPRLGAGGLLSTVDLGPQPSLYRVLLSITVDDHAEAGPVRFRLASEFGTSPAGALLVEPPHEVTAEGETGHGDDSSAQHPARAALPGILAGVISEPGDTDYFSVTVEAGQRLVFEEAGGRVGSKVRPVVDLLSDDHAPVRAGSHSGGLAQRAFVHEFEQAGTYLVRISDYERSGSSDHFYRLRVGNHAVVESAYPLGVRRGATTAVTLKGLNLGDSRVEVHGDPSWMDDRRVLVRATGKEGRGSSPFKLALGEHPEIESGGGNTSVESAQRIDVPVTVNGRLQANAHHFRFAAQRDELVLIDVTAAQVGSPLDSVIDVLAADGEPIEVVTLRAVAVTHTDLFDHNSNQAEIRLQLSNDFDAGDYLLLGSEVMLVTRMPRQPDEGIALESFPPVIPGRPAGGAVRLASFGTSPQAHAKGTPMYKLQVHPPGAQFPPNGLPVVRLRYHNDDGRFPRGKDSFLRFRAPSDGEYVVRIRDSHGRSGEDFAYRLALRPPRPDFQLSADPPAPNVPQGERIPLRVTALREDGFDGAIRVSVRDLPAGLSAADTVIPPGQMVATVMLKAAAAASIGESFPLVVTGTAEVGGKTVTKRANPADRLQLVAVTAPADIEITTDRREVVLRPGEDARIKVTVERRNGFAGRVPVEVLNLPPHTDTPEVGLNRIMIIEEEESREFSIRALPGAKPLRQMVYVAGIVETRSSQPTAFTAEPIELRIVEAGGDSPGAE